VHCIFCLDSGCINCPPGSAGHARYSGLAWKDVPVTKGDHWADDMPMYNGGEGNGNGHGKPKPSTPAQDDPDRDVIHEELMNLVAAMLQFMRRLDRKGVYDVYIQVCQLPQTSAVSTVRRQAEDWLRRTAPRRRRNPALAG